MSNFPLYFVRSGWIDVVDGVSWFAGEDYNYWSSTATFSSSYSSATLDAYHLGFFDGEIDPSHGPAGRWYALPLR